MFNITHNEVTRTKRHISMVSYNGRKLFSDLQNDRTAYKIGS